MVRFSGWKWAIDQLSSLPSVSAFKADLAGKTVIVTGANTGLGLEAARHFATMNPARLILGCRNSQKADAAIESIRKSTAFSALEAWSLDLADFASIREFANRFELDGGGRLDLLVENAGMFTTDFRTTVDGWETMLQVNHLGPSLLALLLLPYLQKSSTSPPTPRLVLVGSEGHLMVQSLPESKSPAILEKMNDKGYCTNSVMGQRYFVSKLFTVFFTRALASRVPSPPAGRVTVTCVNPGYCRSDLINEVRGFLFLVKRLGDFIFGRTLEVGSRNIVWAAIGGREGEVHGRYLSNCRVEEESDLVLSKEGSEFEDKLWHETIDILSRIDPRVKSIVDEHLTRV